MERRKVQYLLSGSAHILRRIAIRVDRCFLVVYSVSRKLRERTLVFATHLTETIQLGSILGKAAGVADDSNGQEDFH